MHRPYLKAEAADCAGLLVTVTARHRADRVSSRQACGQMAGSTVMASVVGEPINHSFPSEANSPTAILLGVLVVQRDPGRRQNALLPLCYLLQCRRHPHGCWVSTGWRWIPCTHLHPCSSHQEEPHGHHLPCNLRLKATKFLWPPEDALERMCSNWDIVWIG